MILIKVDFREDFASSTYSRDHGSDLPEEVVGTYVGSYAPTLKNAESGRSMSGTGVATNTPDGTFSARMTAKTARNLQPQDKSMPPKNVSAEFMASGSVVGSLSGTISCDQINITYSFFDGCEGTGTGVRT